MSETFDDLRPLLFSIAYRMLGSVADAEDVVQEASLRWLAARTEEIASPKAFLTTVVTRLAIDELRSARARRETYVGPWLPEPIVSDPGPEDAAETADSLSMAFLVLLESLTPVERAVFLLREVFSYDYPEIARIVGRTEANCRQILVRARAHVDERRPRFEADRRRKEELTVRFMAAAVSGDMEGLLEMLADDAVLVSDGGGVVRAARRPVYGSRKVARLMIALARAGGAHPLRMVDVNGQPGFLLYEGEWPFAVLTLDVAPEAVQGVRIIVNPEKLRSVRG